jgi:hypothetical protein
MRTRTVLVSAMGAAAFAVAGPSGDSVSAARQNVDAMARWTAATVVRYHVVAEFSGDALIVETAERLPGRGAVTDRFEVDFDWNQQEYTMVGTPVIRNSPSKVGGTVAGIKCPATVNGPFEHWTVVAVRNDDALRYANAVRAEVRRDLPAGTVATMSENGPCASVRQASARTQTLQMGIPATPGMMLGMPSAQGGVQHNGKSFVIKASNTQDKGWTFTVTPTIVK